MRGPAVEAVYATGTVEPVRWAAVAPAQKARLREVLVDDGDRVAAGQVLARTRRHGNAGAGGRGGSARPVRARRKPSARTGWPTASATARSEVDRARSEAHALEAAAEAVRRRLDDFDLKAPIDGVVLRRDGEPGEMVDTTDTVFWIGERQPLRITADVDEEDVPRVRPGQKALLRADAYPDRVLEGRLVAITPKGDPVQKTYRVRIELPDDAPLMIGMTVEANIVVRETRDAVLVPTTAVRDGGVYVVTARALPPPCRRDRRGWAAADRDPVRPDRGRDGGRRAAGGPGERRSRAHRAGGPADPASRRLNGCRARCSWTSPWAICASASGRPWSRSWAWRWASGSSSASTR